MRCIRNAARRCIALVATAVLASCEIVSLSFDGSNGLIVVVVSDGGTAWPGGYRIRTRQAGAADRIVAAAPGRELSLAVASTEPVELTLLLPTGCRTTSPNPLIVAPSGDSAARASFAVDCAAAAIAR